MGSGLCKTNRRPRAPGVDGLYRKIVFNYAKQWTRYSDKHPKNGKRDLKHNKKTKKPTISRPFPADPDSLEGDKWRYVILTRLDADKPPARPPRIRRQPRRQTDGETARWSRRLSGRRSRRRPTAVDGRSDGTDRSALTRVRDRSESAQRRLGATRLAELALRVYGPKARPRSLPCAGAGPGTETKVFPTKGAWIWRFVSVPDDRRPRYVGLFKSVRCVGAMTDSLLSL